jgi:hypothetical protein
MPELTLGTAEGVYTNTFFGFSITPPANFHRLSPAGHAELMGITEADLSNPDVLSNQRTLSLFAAYRHNPELLSLSTINPHMQIIAEKTSRYTSSKDYLYSLLSYLEEQQTNTSASKIVTHTYISGKRFYILTVENSFNFDGDSSDLPFTQVYKTTRIHGYMLTFTFTNTEERIEQWMNEILSTLTFS